MFFPHLIKSIRNTDKVLEIGPGATPHIRSDMFLELNYKNETERIAQSGHVGILSTKKPIKYYDGTFFPFEDNEFDYVICSHVLEHVQNLNLFLKEIARVSKRGYIEFPTPLYDYIYDFPEHLNFCFWDGYKVCWGKKSDFNFENFRPFNIIFYETLKANYFEFIDKFEHLFFQGFEWEGSINCERKFELKELTFNHEEAISIIYNSLNIKNKKLTKKNWIKDKIKRKLLNIIDKI